MTSMLVSGVGRRSAFPFASPFGKIREAVSASLAAGMHRSFVGSPSRGEGLRFLRMTTERGRVLGRWGHLRLRGFSKSPPFRKKREKDGAARQQQIPHR